MRCVGARVPINGYRSRKFSRHASDRQWAACSAAIVLRPKAVEPEDWKGQGRGILVLSACGVEVEVDREPASVRVLRIVTTVGRGKRFIPKMRTAKRRFDVIRYGFGAF